MHNCLKKTSAKKGYDQTKKVRHSCHRHFYQFSKQLLDDNSSMALHLVSHSYRYLNSSKRCTMLSLGTLSNQHGCQQPHAPTLRQSLSLMRSGRMRFTQPSKALSPLLCHLLLTKLAVSSSRMSIPPHCSPGPLQCLLVSFSHPSPMDVSSHQADCKVLCNERTKISIQLPPHCPNIVSGSCSQPSSKIVGLTTLLKIGFSTIPFRRLS